MIKANFFNKIDNCPRRDSGEQFSQRNTCKIFITNIDKINTIQKNVFDRKRHLTSYALWWFFISENESMSKMSMADAKSMNYTFVSSR